MGHAGVNIEGLCCFVSQGIAIVHIAVEDASAARREAQQIGLRVYEERPVALIEIPDQPGAAGELLRGLAAAGVSLELAYFASRTRMIIAADDLEKVNAVVG